MKVLVVAAHPDDETLGCGGTIARLAQEGHEVHILILGEGLTARRSQVFDERALATHHAQAEKASKILGASSIFFEKLPDNRFDGLELLTIVQIIEKHIEQIQPQWIFTQHGGDLNVDHGYTFRATLTAARPLPHSPVKALFAYEVPSCTEWAFQKIHPIFEPNVFFNIGDTMDKKLQAMATYDTETRPAPHPRSPEVLTAIAKRWGSVSGLGAAEPFQLIWERR